MTESFTEGLGRRILEARGEYVTPATTDPVQAAAAALSQAQAKLELAERRKADIPYDQNVRRHPSRLAAWERAVADVAQAKGEITTAEKQLRIAQNDVARKQNQSQFRQAEQERAARREEEQRRHATLEEASYKEACWSAFVAEGGNRERFDQVFPMLWSAELQRRTLARMGEQERQFRQSGRYSF